MNREDKPVQTHTHQFVIPVETVVKQIDTNDFYGTEQRIRVTILRCNQCDEEKKR